MPARDRDVVWFEHLYEDSYAAVFAYALRRSSRADAEDVTSEVFAIAWRRRESLPDPAVAWLIGVARGVLANNARGGRRRLALLSRLAATTSRAVWNPEVASSDPLLRCALERLSDLEREALLLVAWEGLTPSELATALGCTPAAARLRLRRARRQLVRALGAEPHLRPSDEARKALT